MKAAKAGPNFETRSMAISSVPLGFSAEYPVQAPAPALASQPSFEMPKDKKKIQVHKNKIVSEQEDQDQDEDDDEEIMNRESGGTLESRKSHNAVTVDLAEYDDEDGNTGEHPSASPADHVA